jgi:DNA repair exonuclease SbcCD ATPase subunit
MNLCSTIFPCFERTKKNNDCLHAVAGAGTLVGTAGLIVGIATINIPCIVFGAVLSISNGTFWIREQCYPAEELDHLGEQTSAMLQTEEELKAEIFATTEVNHQLKEQIQTLSRERDRLFKKEEESFGIIKDMQSVVESKKVECDRLNSSLEEVSKHLLQEVQEEQRAEHGKGKDQLKERSDLISTNLEELNKTLRQKKIESELEREKYKREIEGLKSKLREEKNRRRKGILAYQNIVHELQQLATLPDEASQYLQQFNEMVPESPRNLSPTSDEKVSERHFATSAETTSLSLDLTLKKTDL